MTEEVFKGRVPAHVGIILDGNGRWAEQRGLPRSEGHRAGAENVVKIARVCDHLGIKALSLYAFSTENWKRSPDEVAALMKLLILFVRRYLDELMEEGARITMMGDPRRLPYPTRQAVAYAIEQSRNNTGLIINIGLNYGGRDEIIRAVHAYGQEGRSIERLDEAALSAHLDTAALPPLDLIIRTGGEMRLSNFMLWQAAYAELAFSDYYWPDFDEKELVRLCQAFAHRERRFGGVQ